MVAQVIAWSLRCSAIGVAPAEGCFGEALGGQRAKLSGATLADGWRGTFFGCKYDAKARKETNRFPRSYLHNLICESCFAQKKHKGWNSLLTYKNFYPGAVHRMTQIGH